MFDQQIAVKTHIAIKQSSPKALLTDMRRTGILLVGIEVVHGSEVIVLHSSTMNGDSVGNLARGLMRLPIDPTNWTGPRLVRLIELNNREKGMTQPESVRSTLGLFLHQVHAGLA